MNNKVKIKILIVISAILFFVSIPINVKASIIRQEVNNSGASTYYVSTESENLLVLSVIKANMKTSAKIIYSGKMVPSSKSYIQNYYFTRALKCNYSYINNAVNCSYETGLSYGMSIPSIKYNKNNTISVKYNFSYYETSEQTKYVNQRINDAIKANMSNLKTDYQKAQWAYQWVLDNLHYDLTLQNVSAYSGLQDTGTVCRGYAVIYCAIADKLGLDCRYIEGSVLNSEINNHAWNIIKLDGKWYCIDTTWGDDYHDTNEYFLKAKNNFETKDYGYHKANVYNNYISAGYIFATTDYIDSNNTDIHGVLPSVYNINMDVLKYNILSKKEKYNFMVSNPNNVQIYFKSSNDKAASVNRKGVVTGLNKGQTTITAYNTDLNIEQNCVIIVK